LKVFINLTDHIECKDELVARYVELYLKSIEDKLRKTEYLKKEVCSIRIPKSRQDIEKILKQYENMEKEMKEIPQKIRDLEREIDQRVYKLYGLTEDEIKIVEESIS